MARSIDAVSFRAGRSPRRAPHDQSPRDRTQRPLEDPDASSFGWSSGECSAPGGVGKALEHRGLRMRRWSLERSFVSPPTVTSLLLRCVGSLDATADGARGKALCFQGVASATPRLQNVLERTWAGVHGAEIARLELSCEFPRRRRMSIAALAIDGRCNNSS